MQYSIYKLSRDDTDDVYYGSTKNTLSQRFTLHKSDGKNKKIKYKCTSAKLFETDANVKIELLENCGATNVKDREAYYIRNFKCLNNNIPNRTKKEFNKQYNVQNKEKLKKKRKLHEVGETLERKNENQRIRDRYNKSHFGTIARAYF
tara:strand:- start:318 stop:761 length:444 start_codon:yes stop_codon:yes gene_type:complete